MKNKPIIILGPTASGKTRLAVALAETIHGEIISADSRQVYQGMDIGTGKDLKEYKHIPYHLIDHKKPGTRYNVQEFMMEAEYNIKEIQNRNAVPIICGGTGLYIQGLIQGMPFNQIPQNMELRTNLASLNLSQIQNLIRTKHTPPNFSPDLSTHKRAVRALEIIKWWEEASDSEISIFTQQTKPTQEYTLFGIDIPVQMRRVKITNRLKIRLDEGLVNEVQNLLNQGITHNQLEYYGLEYKYTSWFLKGEINETTYFDKLNTEIHRFAKRQMTYFRKMEKDGIKIHWIPFQEKGPECQVQAILSIISKNQHS